MKRFHLQEEERRTLFDMGLWHAHPRVRRRASAAAFGPRHHATQAAIEFDGHLNSVRAWMRHWQTAGLVGLYEAHHAGRPRKLSPVVAQKLQQVVQEEGGTIGHIMHCMEAAHMPLLVRPESVARWLKEMGFSYKRYRASVKKSAIPSGLPRSHNNSTP